MLSEKNIKNSRRFLRPFGLALAVHSVLTRASSLSSRAPHFGSSADASLRKHRAKTPLASQAQKQTLPKEKIPFKFRLSSADF